MDIFFKDIENGEPITWDFLINDINNSLTYNPYCKSDNYYHVFKHIIVSLIIGKEIILLDSDFTNSELVNVTGFSEYEEFTELNDKGSYSLLCANVELIEK